MGKVVALAGGVGGAKLAHGLYQELAPDELTVIVNTGDDFTHWGLRISPDLDTVMYTLAGIANEQTGWGIAGETWNALGAIGRLGAPTWFQIGDQDLATHVVRTAALRDGQTLSAVTAEMADRLDVQARLLPMADAEVATMVRTPAGWLAFQDYFVRRHHQDQVLEIRLDGVEQAGVSQSVHEAIADAEVIVFCPSNPIVSIGPILAVPGLRDLLRSHDAPKVAVSPIVGGKALRGPADTMLWALGHDASALGVARLYRGLLTGLVIDHDDAGDEAQIRELGLQVLVTETVMRTVDDRRRLAAEILAWCRTL